MISNKSARIFQSSNCGGYVLAGWYELAVEVKTEKPIGASMPDELANQAKRLKLEYAICL